MRRICLASLVYDDIRQLVRFEEFVDTMNFLNKHGMVALCQAYSFDYLDDLAGIFPVLLKRLINPEV